MIECTVLVIHDHWVLVEFSDFEGRLQRKYVPRVLASDIFAKGPVSLSEETLRMSMEYSNVDLVETLGETLPPISVLDLQDRLRRAGLWTRADYQQGIKIVTSVLTKLRGYDTSLIMNASQRVPESPPEVT